MDIIVRNRNIRIEVNTARMLQSKCQKSYQNHIHIKRRQRHISYFTK